MKYFQSSLNLVFLMKLLLRMTNSAQKYKYGNFIQPSFAFVLHMNLENYACLDNTWSKHALV